MKKKCFINCKDVENPCTSRQSNRQSARLTVNLKAHTHCFCFEGLQGVRYRKKRSMDLYMFSTPCKPSFFVSAVEKQYAEKAKVQAPKTSKGAKQMSEKLKKRRDSGCAVRRTRNKNFADFLQNALEFLKNGDRLLATEREKLHKRIAAVIRNWQTSHFDFLQSHCDFLRLAGSDYYCPGMTIRMFSHTRKPLFLFVLRKQNEKAITNNRPDKQEVKKMSVQHSAPYVFRVCGTGTTKKISKFFKKRLDFCVNNANVTDAEENSAIGKYVPHAVVNALPTQKHVKDGFFVFLKRIAEKLKNTFNVFRLLPEQVAYRWCCCNGAYSPVPGSSLFYCLDKEAV